jgi:hypothetical protein
MDGLGDATGGRLIEIFVGGGGGGDCSSIHPPSSSSTTSSRTSSSMSENQSPSTDAKLSLLLDSSLLKN